MFGRRSHYDREPVLTADLAAEQAFDDAWTQCAAARRLEADIQTALAACDAAPDGPDKDRLARRVKLLADCRPRPGCQWRATRNVREDPAAGGWSNHRSPKYVPEEV